MKIRNVVLITLLFLAPMALAVQFFNSSGQELGNFNKVKCATGITCTQTSGKLEMVSSSLSLENGETLTNSVDDTIQVTSNDEHMTFLVKGFEAKDAILGLYADEGDDSADKFSLKYSAAGALTFEVNASAIATMTGSNGNLALTGDLSGDGGDQLVGFLQNQVATTTTTATAAQCGSTFVSDSADTITLPDANTVLGCRYTFVCGTADDFHVDTDGTDVIGTIAVVTGTNTTVYISPSAGDRIMCTDIGSSVTLQAVAADLWVAIGAANGVWTDAN